jgi:O-antigen/teichoic acid export membrane protein
VSLEVSVAYVALRGVGGVLSVATLAVLARAYGPTGYAEVALAVGGALLVSSIVFGPLHAALARFSDGRGPDQAALANLFYRAAASIVLTACVVAAGWSGHAAVIMAAAALAITQGAFDYAVQYGTSLFQPQRVGLLYLSKSGLGITAATLVLWFAAPAWCAVVSLALVAAIAVASFGRDALSHRWTPLAVLPRDRLLQMLAFSAPLAIVGGLVFCAQWADRAVVGGILGASAFGAYVAVADLTQQLIGMLFSGIGAAWYPRLVRASGEGNEAEVRRLFDRYVELLWVLLVPAVVGLAAVARPLASVVFGVDFKIGSGWWIPILALGAGLAGVKAFLIDLPLFLRKQMVLHACIVATVAALSTGVALLLVPRFGVSGASVSYFAAMFVGCLCSLIAVRGYARVTPDPRTFLGVMAACVAMLAIALTFVGSTVVELALAVGAGASTYVAALWLLNVSDIRTAGRRLSDLVLRAADP